jgi:hypothetical protein
VILYQLIACYFRGGGPAVVKFRSRSPSKGTHVPGVGTVRFVMESAGDADDVLRKTKDVLSTILQHGSESWPSEDEWRKLLPAWFVARCAQEKSAEEAEKWLEWWRGLPPDQQEQANRENWSLSNWLAWFEPGEEHWSWWDASVENVDRILMGVGPSLHA